MGYVPQDPLAALNSLLLVGDQITEAERLHAPGSRRGRVAREILRGYGFGSRGRGTIHRAGELLAEVRISDPEARAAQYPAELSGGMRQRAIIAGAVSTDPDLLIADEPTTALDASVEKQVLELLDERRKAHSTAMLLVTHDLNVASWHCGAIVVLYAGRTMESGPTERLFSRPRHPYTGALLAATPDLERPPATVERRRQEAGARRSDGCPFAPRCPNALDVCWERFPETSHDEDGHPFWCHNPL
jgi:oligopeptide/dipeptide ABC transporter ATP-binding protein